MGLNLSNPSFDEINYLKKLLDSGQLTNEELSGQTTSVSYPQNILSQMVQNPEQFVPRETPLDTAVAGQGFQGIQSGQGVIQSTNPDGTQNAPIRINSSQSMQRGPERDWSRPMIDVNGQRGFYGKDGRIYTPDGSIVSVVPEGTTARNQAAEDRRYKLAQMQANIDQSNAATERSIVETSALRTKPADKPIWDSERGGFVTPEGFKPVPGITEKGQKPTEGYMKQQGGVTNVISALDSYKAALKDFSITDLASPDARSNIDTLYNNAMLQAKEAYNLGVLNGPDYEILTKTLTPATSLRGAMTSKDALLKQIDTFQGLMQKVGEGSATAHKQPYLGPKVEQPKAAKSFDSMPLASSYKGKILRSPDGKRYISDGSRWVEQ